ncbi:uncharacterized protein DUF4843 [Chitinophaga dinghuensis]|uniref:Uncharacterized protein DUF4843 n=1 Tax=Chitinophaga dinghuensis TaxID=1539050 RepID=A0A327VMQ4_9BACT|nr:DUF4843 domain-containing protein [Chitinophaga dinghuensis]RAJ75093.1 uncharacterized protein DUF4843 [Chitinophaga dinghuensis]
MKKLALFIFLITGVLLFSCKKSGLMQFTARSNVYFPVSPDKYSAGVADEKGSIVYGDFSNNAKDTVAVDTLVTNFGFFGNGPKEMYVLVTVSVMGDTSSVDRKVNLTVDPSSTVPAGIVSFDPATCIIRHGKSSASIPMKILRDPSLATNKYFVTLNLGVTDQLSTDYKGELVASSPKKLKTCLQRTYSITDNIPQPTWWVGGNSIGSYYFEEYSPTKMKFLTESLMIPLSFLLQNQPNLSIVGSYSQAYNCGLAKARKAGTPVMDVSLTTGQTFPMKSSMAGGTLCD